MPVRYLYLYIYLPGSSIGILGLAKGPKVDLLFGSAQGPSRYPRPRHGIRESSRRGVPGATWDPAPGAMEAV